MHSDAAALTYLFRSQRISPVATSDIRGMVVARSNCSRIVVVIAAFDACSCLEKSSKTHAVSSGVFRSFEVKSSLAMLFFPFLSSIPFSRVPSLLLTQ